MIAVAKFFDSQEWTQFCQDHSLVVVEDEDQYLAVPEGGNPLNPRGWFDHLTQYGEVDLSTFIQ